MTSMEANRTINNNIHVVINVQSYAFFYFFVSVYIASNDIEIYLC